jgi:hypothetical protein
MGLTGQIISRGSLISQMDAAGGIYGSIAVQGDIGAFATNLSFTSPTRVGGIATDTQDIGNIIAMGEIIGNVTLAGGLLQSGLIATRGSILGNVAINGLVAPTAKIISGGSIGSAALGTGISFGANEGIVAAYGVIINKLNSPTVTTGYYSSDAGAVPPPNNFDAEAIDAVFETVSGSFLTGFDLFAEGDLEGLNDILIEMALLHVADGHLSGE